jgi:hypothetical protein
MVAWCREDIHQCIRSGVRLKGVDYPEDSFGLSAQLLDDKTAHQPYVSSRYGALQQRNYRRQKQKIDRNRIEQVVPIVSQPDPSMRLVVSASSHQACCASGKKLPTAQTSRTIRIYTRAITPTVRINHARPTPPDKASPSIGET